MIVDFICVLLYLIVMNLTQNTEYKKLLIGSGIVLAYCFTTIFTDYPSVDKNVIFGFYFYKLMSLVLTGTIFYLTYFKKYKPFILNRLFLVVAAFYCCGGEIFCPGYHLAFIQVILTTVLIYETSKKFTISFLITFAFIYFLIFSQVNFNTVNVKNYESYFLDIQVAIVSVFLLALFLYIQVTKYKKEKEFFSKKYESLGKRFSFLVHDLKGKIQSPSLEVEYFISNFKNLNKEEIEETLKDLNNTFKDIKDSLQKLNSIDEEKGMVINLKELIKNMFENYNFEQNHEIEYKGLTTVKGSFRDFESIFSNLIKNSIENFNDKKIKGKILINIKENDFYYEDNGGGFPKEIISKINNGVPVMSRKQNGNGIGVSSVFETVQKNDGVVSFYNERGKACVKIEM